MNEVVDFTILRDITGGDRELERELFTIYFESADECLTGMRASIPVEDADEWRKQAHALKGSSMNLGADQLGMLCQTAQKNPDLPIDQKQALLAEIESEYERVRECLQKEIV